MKEPRNHLPRDLKALSYLDALNAGDLEAVSILWEEASHDPELERMLAELDGAIFPEVVGNPSSLPEPLGRGHRRWTIWGVSLGTLAAACLLAILTWRPRDTQNPGSQWSIASISTSVSLCPRQPQALTCASKSRRSSRKL